jgi:hypothetical protein
VHIFYNHTDEECVAKYNRRVEDVVATKATKRLRAQLMMKLRHASIHELCLELLPKDQQ